LNRVLAIFAAALTLLLLSCGGKPETPAEDSASEAPPIEADMAADDAPRNATSDEECGSLKPLLAVLPTDLIVDNLTESFRGCDQSSRGVKVIYATTSGPYTEYAFTVEVIDGKSPLLDTWFSLNGTPESRESLRTQLTQTGNIGRVRLDQCRNYNANPIKADGRNPLIVQQSGRDVCVMDGMDADKEHWFTFSFTPQLRVELELIGARAGELKTTAAASAHLMPLFARFKPANAPN
jgi:hypothetical protein